MCVVWWIMTRKKYLEGNLLTITPESCDRSFSTSARASRILASIPALATPATRFGDNSWTSRAILQMTVLHHTDWCILIFIKNTFTTFQFHSTEKKNKERVPVQPWISIFPSSTQLDLFVGHGRKRFQSTTKKVKQKLMNLGGGGVNNQLPRQCSISPNKELFWWSMKKRCF